MKRALILGGSSGIGKATVKKLAGTFDEIVVVHRDRRIDANHFQEFLDLISKENKVKLINFNVDGTDRDVVQDIIKKIENGPFQLVLHAITRGNLGSFANNGSQQLDTTDLKLTLDSMCLNVQLWSSMLFKNHLLTDKSRFITLTSEGSTRHWDGYGAVALAKSALETLTKYLAVEMAKFGIRYNCIHAGVTETPSLKLIPEHEKLIEFTKGRNPYGRLTTPEDVANAIYLLTLPEADWINGALIHVDGGEHLV